MPPFHSYYWTGAELTAAVTADLAALQSRGADKSEVLASLGRLLGSRDTAARCVGLDWFSMMRSQSRHGGSADEELRPIEDDVRRVALQELTSPPSEASISSGVRGANHGSAFVALGYVGEKSDADVLARALDANDEPEVLSTGTMTATGVVHRQAFIPPALAAALGRIVHDTKLPIRTRVNALETAALSKDPLVVRWLLDALESSDIVMSAAAGRQLLRRDKAAHRERVGALAASWPSGSEAPWEVQETRQLLDEAD
jgi:hypothetical protein